MTLEDRVRRVLHDAVATEPPQRGAPLQVAIRRRRRRPVLAGAVAAVLVLAAVAGLAAVRSSHRPLPSTDPTAGWKVFSDTTSNLRLRYPPGWRLEVDGNGVERSVRLIPTELAGQRRKPSDQPRRFGFEVWLGVSATFWIGEDWFGTTSQGRLPDGRPYLRAEMPRSLQYSIDWGRPCTGAQARCAAHSLRAGILATDDQLWGRHRAVAETIVQTIRQLRPGAPSAGDRSLPPCGSEQWRLVWPQEYGGPRGSQGTAIQGGIQYRDGPRCHFRLTVTLHVENARGEPLPVKGNPASTVIEGDLPLDGMRRVSGSWEVGFTPMWRFIWDEWCNRGLPKATLRLVADGGATISVPGLDPARDRNDLGGPACRDRGRPSAVAGWP
jgi:hypothetical protein